MRLLRGGITERRRDRVPPARASSSARASRCPRPSRGYFEALASWAVESRIADRERHRADLAEFIRKRREETA